MSVLARFYRAMLRLIAVEPQSFRYHDHRLEYFENTFTAEKIKIYARADPQWAIWCNGNTPKL